MLSKRRTAGKPQLSAIRPHLGPYPLSISRAHGDLDFHALAAFRVQGLAFVATHGAAQLFDYCERCRARLKMGGFLPILFCRVVVSFRR